MAKVKIDRTIQGSFYFVPIQVLLDGKRIGSIRSGRSFEFEVPNGVHSLQATFLMSRSNIQHFEASHGNFTHYSLGSDVNMLKNIWMIVKHPLILLSLYLIDKQIHWDYFLLFSLIAYLLYELVENKRKKRQRVDQPEPDKYYIYLREII
jgi:hypothetical protein